MSENAEPLVAGQRRRGRRFYLWFNAINGIAYGCLGETVLILFALEAGLPEYLVGVLTSLSFLAMPAVVLGKVLVRRYGCAATIARTWALRNLFALLMAAAPLFAVCGRWATLTVLLTAAFGFFFSRSAGLIGFAPLKGDIAEVHERGRLNSYAFGLQYTSLMVTVLGLAVVMYYWSGLRTFQYIMVFGALMGFVSVPVIGNTPESAGPRLSAGQPMLKAWRGLRDDSNLRKQIWASAAAIAGNMLVIAISVAALKKGYGVSDTVALVFTLVQFAAAILLSLGSSVISDHTGPRPLLIIYGACLLVICALWVLAPATLHFSYIAVIFLLCGVVTAGIPMSLEHYFLVAVPNERQVMGSIFKTAVGGLASGLLGTIVSAGVLRVLMELGLDGLTLYRGYFTILPLFLLGAIWTILRLEPLEEWRLRRVVALLFSPGDLRALYAISRFDETGRTEDDTRHIDTLGGTRSALSESALLAFLESPDFGVRARALTALREIELTAAGEDALIRELRERPYTTAYLAAEALGEKHVHRAVPDLRAALAEADPYLCGKSMVALARLEDADSFPRLREILRTTTNPRVLIHAGMALAETGRPEFLADLFARAADPRVEAIVRHELLYRAASLAGCRDAFYTFLKAWRRDPAAAWRDTETLPATDAPAILDALAHNPRAMAIRGALPGPFPDEWVVCLWYCARQ